MSDTIIVALITGGLSLLGVCVTAFFNRQKITKEFERQNAEYQRQAAATDAKLDKKLAIVETKIEMLTTEVRKHNNFAERIPALEQKVSDMNERLKYREQLG